MATPWLGHSARECGAYLCRDCHTAGHMEYTFRCPRRYQLGSENTAAENTSAKKIAAEITSAANAAAENAAAVNAAAVNAAAVNTSAGNTYAVNTAAENTAANSDQVTGLKSRELSSRKPAALAECELTAKENSPHLEKTKKHLLASTGSVFLVPTTKSSKREIEKKKKSDRKFIVVGSVASKLLASSLDREQGFIDIDSPMDVFDKATAISLFEKIKSALQGERVGSSVVLLMGLLEQGVAVTAHKAGDQQVLAEFVHTLADLIRQLASLEQLHHVLYLPMLPGLQTSCRSPSCSHLSHWEANVCASSWASFYLDNLMTCVGSQVRFVRHAELFQILDGFKLKKWEYAFLTYLPLFASKHVISTQATVSQNYLGSFFESNGQNLNRIALKRCVEFIHAAAENLETSATSDAPDRNHQMLLFPTSTSVIDPKMNIWALLRMSSPLAVQGTPLHIHPSCLSSGLSIAEQGSYVTDGVLLVSIYNPTAESLALLAQKPVMLDFSPLIQEKVDVGQVVYSSKGLPLAAVPEKAYSLKAGHKCKIWFKLLHETSTHQIEPKYSIQFQLAGPPGLVITKQVCAVNPIIKDRIAVTVHNSSVYPLQLPTSLSLTLEPMQPVNDGPIQVTDDQLNPSFILHGLVVGAAVTVDQFCREVKVMLTDRIKDREMLEVLPTDNVLLPPSEAVAQSQGCLVTDGMIKVLLTPGGNAASSAVDQ